MEHEEFVASSAEGRAWGVRGVAGAVFAVWRGGGLACYGLACLLAAAPLLAFGAWSAVHDRYGALGWMVPAAVAFLAARPGLNLVDSLPWLACGFVGLVVSIWAGPLHLAGGAAVLATWILAGAVRGSTMAVLEHRLRSSKDAYDRLKAAGKLVLIPRRREIE